MALTWVIIRHESATLASKAVGFDGPEEVLLLLELLLVIFYFLSSSFVCFVWFGFAQPMATLSAVDLTDWILRHTVMESLLRRR